MSIRVEFYGVVRQRAGEPGTILPTTGPTTLGWVVAQLTAEYPGLADNCFHAGRMRLGYVANIDGKQFINDPASLIEDNTSLLIMSADAGG